MIALISVSDSSDPSIRNFVLQLAKELRLKGIKVLDPNDLDPDGIGLVGRQIKLAMSSCYLLFFIGPHEVSTGVVDVTIDKGKRARCSLTADSIASLLREHNLDKEYDETDRNVE